MLVSLVVSPLFDDNKLGALFLGITYLALAAAGGYAMVRERRWLYIFIACVLCAFAFELLAAAGVAGLRWRMLSAIAGFGSYALLFWAVFRQSFFHPDVPTPERLVAGISGYLLLVACWSSIAQFEESLIPGSFEGPGIEEDGFDRAAANYFSMVTVSTLGYGDIIPQNTWAQLISGLAAVSGTLYLAVFIAAIMSGYRAHGTRRKDDPPPPQ